MSPLYPSKDIARQADGGPRSCAAPIVDIVPYSPADDAGFTPGCAITAIDGQPVRDVIDWRWLSADDVIDVSYIDADGDTGTVTLEREWGEDWGFVFDGLVFDDVKQCRNACTFCFMHQLPAGMRPSLSLRDDDFRLSFLVGTFVTFTNLSADDEQRIVEQRISPLRMSLQVADSEVRRRLIGKHAQHGLDAAERLLAAGIEIHAQIVLVPGENDGDVLRDTLAWAYERPGILNVGIVPLGYTRFQTRFDHSFNDPAAAREVLDIVEPFQRRAIAERGCAWVYPADEFYSNAYGADVVERIPDAGFYDDFSLFEDGIGIIRSTIDDWREACESGCVQRAKDALESANMHAVMIAGRAQQCFLDVLVEEAGIENVFEPLYVDNEFFGGNVDVTGLLVGADIARAVRADSAERAAHGERALYLLPRVVLNDDGLLLDDMSAVDVEREAGTHLAVVSLSPLDYFEEIVGLVRSIGKPE